MDKQFRNKDKMVSVIIATFNSGKVLSRVLVSLRAQDYPQDKIEILVIDGGSTDNTIDIAKNYGCVIYNNPKTEPVNAKLIGIQKAKGKYLITVDHDEVFENPSSICLRVAALEAHPECKVAFCSGYKRPKDYPALNQYISEFGDPFSLFTYCFSKDYKFYEKALKRRCKVVEDNYEYALIFFENLKKDLIIELCCMGTMINLEYFKQNTNIVEDSAELAHLFYIMLEKGNSKAVITHNDPLVHYSADSLKAYFPKLKWRVCNNVHFSEKGENGFNGRQKYTTSARYKKYLFILYTILFPISGAHALWLAATRRNAVYLLHPLLCFYVLWEIIWQTGKKVLGYTPEFTSYDGKAKVER